MKIGHCSQTMMYWYDQLWNHRNAKPIDTILAEDFVLHGSDGARIDKAGFRAYFDTICSGFSDTHVEVLDHFESENRCAIRLRCTATLAATGKSAQFQMMAIVHFNEEGKAAEAWDTLDWLGYLTRIEALPADTLNKVVANGAKFAAL